MNLIAFQVAIVTTGTAQQLPSNSIVNGVVLLAKSTNTANIEFGNSASVTTSTGAVLEKGEQVTVKISNTNSIYIVGTGGDIISVVGS